MVGEEHRVAGEEQREGRGETSGSKEKSDQVDGEGRSGWVKRCVTRECRMETSGERHSSAGGVVGGGRGGVASESRCDERAAGRFAWKVGSAALAGLSCFDAA